jgi:hypothetical protein
MHHVPHTLKAGWTEAQLATLKAGGIPDGASAAEGAAIAFMRAFRTWGRSRTRSTPPRQSTLRRASSPT